VGEGQARVLKFGGTSVEDTAAFTRVADVVGRHGGRRPVVVVSALAGVTDALLHAADAAASGDPRGAARALEPHLARHAEIARRLLPPDGALETAAERQEIETALLRLLRDTAEHPAGRAALRDEIAACGERLAAALLARVLAARGMRAAYVDARRCIVTDEMHGRATPQLAATFARVTETLGPLLDAGVTPVLGGFIASSAGGVTTTLGRGGSDYTAALVGAALGVDEIQIWTDVSGVLTADPRVVPDARSVARMSYAEAAELAYFGAKVLHPRTIEPAMARRIPVRIANSRRPEDPGTTVTAVAEPSPGAVKAIAHKTGITVLNVASTRMLGAYGFLEALFDVFARHRADVDVVATSEVSVSLTLDDTSALPAILEDLRPLGEVTLEPHRAIVCVVGEGLRVTPGVAARVFGTIADINVFLISFGASRVNLTFVVEEGRVHETVRRLHAALIEEAGVPAPAEATV
jgi:aspartate kinase